jgi:hypothetical protein
MQQPNLSGYLRTNSEHAPYCSFCTIATGACDLVSFIRLPRRWAAADSGAEKSLCRDYISSESALFRGQLCIKLTVGSTRKTQTLPASSIHIHPSHSHPIPTDAKPKMKFSIITFTAAILMGAAFAVPVAGTIWSPKCVS